MGTANNLRALRALILAATAIWSGLSGSLQAQPLSLPGVSLKIIAQPFAPYAFTPMSYGELREKWLAVQQRLDDERVQLALCEGDRERCASPAALQFLTVVDAGKAREGRARLGEINRAINLAIRPMSDLAQYGAIDVWTSPLVTFYRGAGDCEDYAIAKYVALRQAGVSPDDLRIVIMHDAIYGEDHAVAAARLDGHWFVLDNRRMAMIEDVDVRNYLPTFVIDQSGVMKYVQPQLIADISALKPSSMQ